MFDKLKEKIYQFSLKKQHKSASAYPDWEKVKTVLLLFDSDDSQQNLPIKQLVKELSAEGKRVTAWGYTNQKDIIPTTLPNFFVFGKNQVNFWGKPHQFDVMDHFIDKHYDILLDLTLDNSLPMRYLSLLAPVDFRAGRQTDTEPYPNDLMIAIDQDKDAPFLFDQLIFYLKQIKAGKA